MGPKPSQKSPAQKCPQNRPCLLVYYRALLFVHCRALLQTYVCIIGLFCRWKNYLQFDRSSGCSLHTRCPLCWFVCFRALLRTCVCIVGLFSGGKITRNPTALLAAPYIYMDIYVYYMYIYMHKYVFICMYTYTYICIYT